MSRDARGLSEAAKSGGLFDIDRARCARARALKVIGCIHSSQLFLAGMKEWGFGAVVNIIGMAGR